MGGQGGGSVKGFTHYNNNLEEVHSCLQDTIRAWLLQVKMVAENLRFSFSIAEFFIKNVCPKIYNLLKFPECDRIAAIQYK